MLKTKQRWKVINYEHINQAFMTADELTTEYGIYSFDLPKGSRAFHNDWQAEKNKIVVTPKLIQKSLMGKNRVHVIQSKQNLNNLNMGHGFNNNQGYKPYDQQRQQISGPGAICMHRHTFAK